MESLLAHETLHCRERDELAIINVLITSSFGRRSHVCFGDVFAHRTRRDDPDTRLLDSFLDGR